MKSLALPPISTKWRMGGRQGPGPVCLRISYPSPLFMSWWAVPTLHFLVSKTHPFLVRRAHPCILG